MKLVNLPIVVSFDEDTFIARCPLVQGAFAEGDTPEEAISELFDVLRLILQYRREREEDLGVLEALISNGDEKIYTPYL